MAVPRETQPGGRDAAGERPERDQEAPRRREVPDGREVDEQARVGRESPEEPRDDEEAVPVVRVAMTQGPAQQVRGEIRTQNS